MEKIIGYGEDALTLYAINNGMLKKFIKNEEIVKVFYRPSFGRGGWPCFGEFDAIILTNKNIYLIESKWENSNEYKETGSTIVLTEPQAFRHFLFQTYLRSDTKGKLIGNNVLNLLNWEKEQKTKDDGDRSLLFKNLELIKKEIDNIGFKINSKSIKNVLLFFTSKPEPIKLKLELETNKEGSLIVNKKIAKIVEKSLGFKMCVLKFDKLNNTGYFILD
jgi:hypothetical protein